MISVRVAELHERKLGCNTCLDGSDVEVVVELGSDRATTQTRMCKPCFLSLRETVDDAAHWDCFRDEW